ncbi:hypothetical protein AZE42_13456 [Rhizopogon vesiculosus]|nr:hypothetical protein AZE42_13456 [Rhizopogon vesiculosus]
MQWHRSQ